MKITAEVKIKTELFKKYPDAIKSYLRQKVCDELLKHDVFIDPPIESVNGRTRIEMHFFALSYDDVRSLKALVNVYPELNRILTNIIVEK